MRELRHQNVNPFLGAVVEPTRIKIVTDYCTRGSLPVRVLCDLVARMSCT